MEKMRVIISGGGTGGHIFPAISIANAIKERYPEADILFVGAQDRMEMEKVPAAGYKIIGLDVAGFDRTRLLRNIPVLWKLYRSIKKAKKIIKEFNPQIAIGVGGYASGPTLAAAHNYKIPTLIQEPNSYAGVANKLIGKDADCVCVAYEGMDAFFPARSIVVTGTPCRQDLMTNVSEEEAYEYFGLDPDKKTILVVGGSLGAKTLNESIMSNLHVINEQEDIQILWQCGSYYFKLIKESFSKAHVPNLKLNEFISRMDLAYKVADVVVSRAGAGSIAELSSLSKPTILVPSPNVAEDHQTKNAMSLVNSQAAILVKDIDAKETLVATAFDLVRDEEKLTMLRGNIERFAKPDAANKIVDEVVKLIEKKRK